MVSYNADGGLGDPAYLEAFLQGLRKGTGDWDVLFISECTKGNYEQPELRDFDVYGHKIEKGNPMAFVVPKSVVPFVKECAWDNRFGYLRLASHFVNDDNEYVRDLVIVGMHVPHESG